MRKLIYRRATLRDLDALLALESGFPGDRLSRRNFRHLLSDGNAQIWVCMSGSEIIGDAVVLYRSTAGNARLYSLIVAPHARGRGIAAALVKTVEAAAARRHCDRVSLEVRADNVAAARLYKRLGYQLTRSIPHFYEDGQKAHRLERNLFRRPAALAA